MTQYDNSNRLALWKPDRQCVVGYGEFNGDKVDAAIVPTGAKNDRAPTHRLYLSYRDRTDCIAVPLWKEDDKWGGQIDGYWVNVFVNSEKRSENSPDISVVFKEKDAPQAGSRMPSAQEHRGDFKASVGLPTMEDSEIPF